MAQERKFLSRREMLPALGVLVAGASLATARILLSLNDQGQGQAQEPQPDTPPQQEPRLSVGVIDMGSDVLTTNNEDSMRQRATEKSRDLPSVEISNLDKIAASSVANRLPLQDEVTRDLLYAFGIHSFRVGVDESSGRIATFLQTTDSVKFGAKYPRTPQAPHRLFLHTISDLFETKTYKPVNSIISPPESPIITLYLTFDATYNSIADTSFVIQVNAGLFGIAGQETHSFLLPRVFMLKTDPFVPPKPKGSRV